MLIGLGIGIPFRRNYVGSAIFSPGSLFANNEQGVWYDPSDMTTLYQDAAGTTPVTTIEQPVGLMLDKSKGLVLGSELTSGSWVNGAMPFDSFSASGVGFTATKSVSGTPQQAYLGSFPIVAERAYAFEIVVSANTFGVNQVQLGLSTATTQRSTAQVGLSAGASTIRGYLFASSTQAAVSFMVATQSASTGSITVVSATVRELPGNHAFQSTSTKRPVLSARVNLLTKSEKFDDATWVKTLTTFSGNTLTATASTGGHKISQSVTNTGAVTFFADVKAGTHSFVQITGSMDANRYANFDITNGTIGNVGSAATASILALGAGVFRITATFTAGVGFLTIAPSLVAGFNATFTALGTETIEIYKQQLVPADQASLPYQRVNTATDYDTQGFPLYLKCDGIDDAMQTNSINFSYTDKMTVFAGVRKLSNAAVGVIAELSTSAGGGTSGTFVLHGQTSPVGYRYAAGSGSSGAAFATDDASVFTAPITNVVTGISNFAGAAVADEISVRVNGVAPTQTLGGVISTGNYGNYPLYIGARAGTSLFFNGNLYQLVIVGKQASPAEITDTEKYVNSKTLAY